MAKKASVKKPPSIKLTDFAGGIVLGIAFPKLRQDQPTIDQVRAWLTEGLLCSPEVSPDPVMSLIYLTETKAESMPPVTTQSKQSPPKQQPSPPQLPRARLPELRGVAWIAVEQVFTDGLLLPAGCRIEATPESNWVKFEGSASLVKGSLYDLEKETGSRPMVSAIGGKLRVLRREFLTDEKPEIEAKPRRITQ